MYILNTKLGSQLVKCVLVILPKLPWKKGCRRLVLPLGKPLQRPALQDWLGQEQIGQC